MHVVEFPLKLFFVDFTECKFHDLDSLRNVEQVKL